MKPAVVPVSCSLVLVSLAAAGASHWWSVRQLAAISGSSLPVPSPTKDFQKSAPSVLDSKASAEVTKVSTPVPLAEQPPSAASEVALQKMLELNQKTLEEVKRLSKENRDLRDQMAETNRDLMKLEFRVDTHSESFRPLPAGSDQPYTTLDVNRLDSNLDSGGVLPSLDEMLPLPQQ